MVACECSATLADYFLAWFVCLLVCLFVFVLFCFVFLKKRTLAIRPKKNAQILLFKGNLKITIKMDEMVGLYSLI